MRLAWCRHSSTKPNDRWKYHWTGGGWKK